MQKEHLSIDITFNHCYFSLDSPFKKQKMELSQIFAFNNGFLTS